MRSPQRQSRMRGFTLLEMTVVLTIVALLAGIAVPAVTGSVTKGKTSSLKTDLREVQAAVDRFSDTGDFPTVDKKLPTVALVKTQIKPEMLKAVNFSAVNSSGVGYVPFVLRAVPNHNTDTVVVPPANTLTLNLSEGTFTFDNSTGVAAVVYNAWSIDSLGFAHVLIESEKY